MNRNPTVLVIDDHLAIVADKINHFYDQSAFLEDYEGLGLEYIFCSAMDDETKNFSVDAVIRYISTIRRMPDVILLDVRFGDRELLGIEILRTLYRRYPTIPVIMMTSTAKRDLWEVCMLGGAVDYLVKPIQPEILKQTVDRYCVQNVSLWLVGQSERFLATVDQVARAAVGGRSSILLLGASGTGKELFARFVHRHGPHRDGPFMPVHIPSISTQLVEAELFGYSKGAFTGAHKDEEGRLMHAHGGVLFLDEIGDLSLTVQAALLRVLETREVTRLGDGRISRLTVQVVAATNANLAQKVKDNEFRLDLYSRLATTVLQLPQLSDRRDDIAIIATHFIRRAMLERSIPPMPVDLPHDLIHLLRTQSWPGNLRELWNYIQRVLDLAKRRAPSREDFVKAFETPNPGMRGDIDENHIELHVTRSLLSQLPAAVVKDATSFMEDLVLRELSLLHSALELSRDPLSGLANRAKAASILKRKKCSTNEYDRWVRRLMDRLRPETQSQIKQEFSELFE